MPYITRDTKANESVFPGPGGRSGRPPAGLFRVGHWQRQRCSLRSGHSVRSESPHAQASNLNGPDLRCNVTHPADVSSQAIRYFRLCQCNLKLDLELTRT
jgi:hypothetical protein